MIDLARLAKLQSNGLNHLPHFRRHLGEVSLKYLVSQQEPGLNFGHFHSFNNDLNRTSPQVE